MTRAFAFTMKRPHEAFGIPVPMGRKLGALGRHLSLAALVTAFIFSLGVYVYQAHVASTQSFATRTLEKKLEALQESVSVLENQAAQMQTIQVVQDKIKTMGYVPVEHTEFVEVGQQTYAMAK